jgi:hypothetical protein
MVSQIGDRSADRPARVDDQLCIRRGKSMTSEFTITPTPPTSIRLEVGREHAFSFTLTSQAAPDMARDVVFAALVVGSDGKGKEASWLVVEPRQILGMAGGETATITIRARPTAASLRGEHSIRLVVADKDRPNDVFADSSTVVCDVLGTPGPPPPRKALPWWLIPVIAGGVVLVGGAIWLIVALTGDGAGGLGEPCRSDPTAACDRDLTCVAGAQKCLRVGGAACKSAKAGECASSECATPLEVCTIPLGAGCSPGDQARPCRTGTACDPTRRTCLATEGAPCAVDADCATDLCTASVCTVKPPPLRAGDPCMDTCPAPLQCSATTKRCVEQPGRPCNNNSQCATGLCEQNVCSNPALLRDCTQDGICSSDQQCLEVQAGIKRCHWRAGHPCSGNGECSSRWCNQGVCSRDDGRCTSANECQPPFVCDTAQQRCMKPSGHVCAANAECLSSFCSGNRCEPRNLAAGRPTAQSTTALDGVAARAVDRRTDGNWHNGSVTHTALEAQPWWLVDLGTVADIDKVILYNRTDCCGERLSAFDIQVSNDGSSWRIAASSPGIAPAVAPFLLRTTGRFVRVRLRGTDYLSLAEVEVFTP